MNKKKILKALEENDAISAKKEMRLMFEEKLERKMWKVYRSLEQDLVLDIKKNINK